MRVHVGPIRGTRGASLEVDFKEEFDAPWDDGGTLEGPVHVQARVTNTGRCYVVRGEILADVKLSCHRCLDPVNTSLDTDFDEDFCPETPMPSSHEEFDDPMDAYDQEVEEPANTFDGDSFTLDEIVRDYLVLALPVKVVCREDCAGICASCGQNLNDTKCDCTESDIDPRLAGLADLLDPNERS